MKKKPNYKLKEEILFLIYEFRKNYDFYISHGRLNSEGKKLQSQIIKKFYSFTNDKSILKFIKKSDEHDLAKMINYIEKVLEESFLFVER
ncbi:MAG: hypothetical protein RQ952_03630 [Thermoproteota archaeon]|nr:hypothetical protein [Thermoproteota archaeon]